jgi:hypothetical protein
MKNRERVTALQNKLMKLAELVVKMDWKGNKYETQKITFAPFNSEFKKIIEQLPDSYYLNEDNDKKTVDRIVDLTNKITYKIEELESQNK